MTHLKKFWPLAIPFGIGVFCVVGLLRIVYSAADSSSLEGALFVLAFGAMGASIGLPLLAVGTIVAIAKQWRISFPLYALLLFVTLLPVAYFQCVNAQTSMLSFIWAPLHLTPPDMDHTAERIAFNAGLYLAVFSAVAAGSYAFCRRWI